MTKEELLQLLEHARIRNERLGITGLLLYKSGNFMQMLEGQKGTVLNLLKSIQQDPRHHDVTTINSGEILTRNFPNWTMGFTDMDTCENFPKLADYVQESLLDRRFSEDSQFAYKFMLTFNELNP